MLFSNLQLLENFWIGKVDNSILVLFLYMLFITNLVFLLVIYLRSYLKHILFSYKTRQIDKTQVVNLCSLLRNLRSSLLVLLCVFDVFTCTYISPIITCTNLRIFIIFSFHYLLICFNKKKTNINHTVGTIAKSNIKIVERGR